MILFSQESASSNRICAGTNWNRASFCCPKVKSKRFSPRQPKSLVSRTCWKLRRRHEQRSTQTRGVAMLLTVMQSYELLAKYGCYVTEACDKCGQILGPVRYTRKNETGA